jgi:hypothetical protein
VEVRIGVQNAPREVVLESAVTPDEVRATIDAALASGNTLTLTDDKGRVIMVPGDKIAFVEIGVQTAGRVGFAS